MSKSLRSATGITRMPSIGSKITFSDIPRAGVAWMRLLVMRGNGVTQSGPNGESECVERETIWPDAAVPEPNRGRGVYTSTTRDVSARGVVCAPFLAIADERAHECPGLTRMS